LASCRLIAMVVILAPRYVLDNRHDFVQDLAAVLARDGDDPAMIRAAIRALCAITDDKEFEDRLKAVDDVISRSVDEQHSAHRSDA